MRDRKGVEGGDSGRDIEDQTLAKSPIYRLQRRSLRESELGAVDCGVMAQMG